MLAAAALVNCAWPEAKASPAKVNTSPNASRRDDLRTLVDLRAVEHRLGLLGLRAQARRFLGLDLGLDAQALGFRARALGVAAAGLDQQLAALALEAVDFAAGRLDPGGLLGDPHAAFGEGQCRGLLAAAGDVHGGQGLARLQPFVL